jgi:hypothetical protein
MCGFWENSLNLQRVFHGIRLLRLINGSYLSRDKYYSNSMRNTKHFICNANGSKKGSLRRFPFSLLFEYPYLNGIAIFSFISCLAVSSSTVKT